MPSWQREGAHLGGDGGDDGRLPPAQHAGPAAGAGRRGWGRLPALQALQNRLQHTCSQKTLSEAIVLAQNRNAEASRGARCGCPHLCSAWVTSSGPMALVVKAYSMSWAVTSLRPTRRPYTPALLITYCAGGVGWGGGIAWGGALLLRTG